MSEALPSDDQAPRPLDEQTRKAFVGVVLRKLCEAFLPDPDHELAVERLVVLAQSRPLGLYQNYSIDPDRFLSLTLVSATEVIVGTHARTRGQDGTTHVTVTSYGVGAQETFCTAYTQSFDANGDNIVTPLDDPYVALQRAIEDLGMAQDSGLFEVALDDVEQLMPELVALTPQQRMPRNAEPF